MRLVDSILNELEVEAATTRRVLERVPGDKLTWKPHAKSMSLGELALHVATTPGGVAGILRENQIEAPNFANRPSAKTSAELLAALEKSVGEAKSILNGMNDETLLATWKMTKDGKDVLVIPRAGMVRSILLNHWYHHRGQLSVYLRLLDVPVPSIYGPSADENPMG
jgi:uncharacterized damage-inducible protein DinB